MKLTLKAARVNANLTQREVAKLSGLSRNTISSYEQGKTYPDIEVAKFFASLYGMSVNDFIFLPKDCALSTTQ